MLLILSSNAHDSARNEPGALVNGLRQPLLSLSGLSGSIDVGAQERAEQSRCFKRSV